MSTPITGTSPGDLHPPVNDRLPRTQIGTTPQHLLMTLIGDYWFERTEHLPSAALVALLAEFDISTAGARAALNRLTKRGLLESSKRGRNTYYGPTPLALPLMEQTHQRIVTFGNHGERAWDGRWTVVAFSVPEGRRQLRHAVRTRLRWLGFAALYDGRWCSPWPEQDAALALLTELEIEAGTVMRVEIDKRSTVQALSAWDLDAVEHRYLAFELEFSVILQRARDGRLSTSEALVQRTKVMDSWRTFLGLEPDLPSELLPTSWPRERTRELFLELYDLLAPVGRARAQQVVAEYDPGLALLITHHSAA